MASNHSLYEPRLLVGLAELADAFDRHKVQYALIGGLAVGLRGRPRSTRDIDLLLTMPQMALPGLLADLTAHGFAIDETTVITDFVRHHFTSFAYQGVRVDWLKSVIPIYHHILDRASVEQGFDRPVRVAEAEGLLLLKLLASRSQDIADIDTLLAANQGRLDLAWVEQEWLTAFSTDDPRWTRFRRAVAEYYDRPGPEEPPTAPAH